MNPLWTLVSLLAFLGTLTAAAGPREIREYSRRIWRVEDGLPQSRVQALAQTPDGYLWVGTPEGLARFDGVRFTVFARSNVPEFRDDSILALRTARDGSLWIGTEGGGLLHYRGGAFHAYSERQGLTNGFVRAIYEDAAGTLWVGADRGVFRKQGERFERLDGTPEFPLATVFSILGDPAGRLLISSSAGLLTMEHGKLAALHCPARPATPQRAIFALRDGALRVLDSNGASRLEEGCLISDKAFPQVRLSVVLEDRSGALWAGTAGNGLFRVRDGVVTLFEAPATLPDNQVTALLEDRQENLWVGGSDGLLRLSKTAVTTVGEKDGLQDDSVSSLYEDRRQRLWIATRTGEIYRMKDGMPERVPLPATGVTAPVRTVFEDSKGTFWFGTIAGGIIRVDHGRTSVLTTRDGLRSNSVRQILEDPQGRIWVATGSGLALWEGTRFRTYYLEDGLSYPSVRALAIAANGDLLIGTDGGLDRMRNGRIHHEAVDAEIGREKIWAIHQDRGGVLWLGTRGSGLLRIEDGHLARFTTSDGLPGNTIYQILEDGKGMFWLSSPLGVYSIERREWDAKARGTQSGTVPVVIYGTSEGMETSQMSGGIQPAGVRTASGEIWFPSVKGAVRIDPAHLPVRQPGPVFIERIVVDGRPQALGTAEIRIPPGPGRVTIDFTTCNLGFPQRESFRYRLEGFESGWTSAHRSRTATYTNVPPGRYRFRVAAGEVGSPAVTSEASVALAFQPALHQTWWFYGTALLLSGALVWGAMRLHARQTSARYALLLAERTRLAREMHDTVIQGCVGVSTLLEASSRYQRSNQHEANQLRDQARLEIKATIHEARQAVWDLRHMSDDPSATPRLFDVARKLASENSIEADTEIVGQRVPLDLATDRTLLLVGREALRNAVSHGHARRVTVRLVFKPKEVRLEVQDDGLGFDSGQSRAAAGHYGIVGMRERVEEEGGFFSIESRPGTGTLVVAEVPLKRRKDL